MFFFSFALPFILFLQGAVSSSLTCLQLHKRAERVAALLMERGGLQEGDHVALVYPPGSRSDTHPFYPHVSVQM